MTDKGSKDPNGMSFTLFIILPTDDVCSLRNLTSGVMIREIRCRLELTAGFSAQIYRLTSPDGQYLHEEHCLVLDHNVWDGYILRANLFDSWLDLFQWVVQGDVDQVYKNGGICLKNGGPMAMDEKEQSKTEDVIHERGLVALFLASFYGLAKMCEMLITAGVDVNGKTPFDNRALHAACCKDHERVVDVLVQHGASLVCKNSKGDTPAVIAKKCFSKKCVRKIRMLQLKISPPNGLVSSNRSSSGVVRKTNLSFVPHPPSSQRPQTCSQSSIKKRQTAASRVVHPKDTVVHRSSQEYFMWDTDNQKTRAASASRYRLGSASSLLAVEDASSAVSRIDTAPAKPTVKWGDPRSRVVASAINRQEPGRQPFRHHPHSILKNGTEHPASVESTCPADSVSSLHDQNDSESHLSMASAPGIGKDSSVMSGYDVRSVESAPDLQQAAELVSHPPQFDRSSTSRLSGRRRTKLLVSRQRENESWKTMKRRITLAANQKKLERDLFPQRTRESFDQWLNRKRREEKRDSRETDSDESESESESKARNAQAFDEWMKRQREKARRGSETVTVTELYRKKTRPIKGLIKTDLILQNETPADPSTNLTAYKEWRENHAEQDSRVENLKIKKEKMEEKRQRLLSMAISYDEWMEHNEERKNLMKEILQASMEELNKIEEDKLKRRAPRQISFKEWNEKTKLHNTKEKKMLQAGDASDSQNLQLSRSSAALTHDMWMRRKDEDRKQRTAHVRQQRMTPSLPDSDKDRDFKSWARRNNQEDLAQMHSDIKRERSMIKTLRDKHTYTVSSC